MGEANHIAVLATKTTASDFGSDQLSLDHHFIAFVHRLMNGGNHFFEGFHFAHTEGATAGIKALDENKEVRRARRLPQEWAAFVRDAPSDCR